MICKCGSESRCIDSRPNRGGFVVRRRRECLDCGERFTTYEIGADELEDIPAPLTESAAIRQDRNRVIRELYREADVTQADIAYGFGLHVSTIKWIIHKGQAAEHTE